MVRHQPQSAREEASASRAVRAWGIAGCLVVAMAVALVGGVVVMMASLGNPFNDEVFSQSEWAAHSGSNDYDNPRGPMYADLRKHHLKRGMTKQAVIELLGEPDSRGSDTEFSYNLGSWSGFRMDPDTLEIEFDGNDRVGYISRVQH